MTAPLSESDLLGLLITSGVRVTEQRITMLRELADAASPVSFTELADRCGVGRATVYRNLLMLADAGVLVRAQVGDNILRFELPRSSTNDHLHHPHLTCTACGAVRCLPPSAISFRGEAAKSEVEQVQLRGRCATCVAATP